MSRLQEVIARVEAAGAEPSTEAAGEASQTDGAASAEGSASADVSTPAASDGAPTDPAVSTSPEAPTTAPDESELQAKLERDREKRAIAAERRRLKAERDQIDRDKAEAQAVRDKWAKLGKEGSIIDRVKEAGGDPREVFEAMKKEALEAGTPEAQIARVTQTFESKIAALEKALTEERNARETERQQAAQARAAHVFRSDFERALKEPDFAPLVEEYPDPEDLFPLVRALEQNPEVLFAQADALGVDLGIDLTDPDATFNMRHIFTVMRAQQAAHEAKRAAAKQRAAPQESQPAQPAEAKKPTVNGTEARKAGTTIGNDLAASSAGAPPDAVHEDHKARLKRLIEKYG